MSLDLSQEHRCQTGFSLVELMVGLTIGFIVMVVIVQTVSVFEGHKRTTTAAADAQENGLLAMMSLEEAIRKAGSGFNDPKIFSCQNYFSYYQDVSGTGVPVSVGSFNAPVPVLIEDQVDKDAVAGVVSDGIKVDRIHVRNGLHFTGIVSTRLATDMTIIPTPESLALEVDRIYDFNGEPASADDPPADLILVVDSPDPVNCSLMRVTSKSGKVLTVANGPAGRLKEYNATHTYMTANNWPGFGTGHKYLEGSNIFRVGDIGAGGIMNTTYSVNANNSLQSVASVAITASGTDILSSEIVDLQAQYGVSTSRDIKTVSSWVNATGATWGIAALTATTPASAVDTAIANRQRIKAVRIAVVARSSKRDGALVTSACTENHAVNYGPCSWTDDTSANPAPAIDLRTAVGDTEWQHYRYKVYQTVIPMRNVLWPNL